MNTIIEKIRAEIERRKNYISVTHFAEELLFFLDTLKEQLVEVQKYRAYLISEIEKQYKQAERNYQEAYEQKNETRMFDEAERDAWKRVLDWLKEEHGYDSSNEDLVPEKEQPVDLEEASQLASDVCYPLENFSGSRRAYRKGFKAGAKWQKEQMMKGLRSYCLDEMERFRGTDEGSRAAREVYYDIIGYLDNYERR